MYSRSIELHPAASPASPATGHRRAPGVLGLILFAILVSLVLGSGGLVDQLSARLAARKAEITYQVHYVVRCSVDHLLGRSAGPFVFRFPNY